MSSIDYCIAIECVKWCSRLPTLNEFRTYPADAAVLSQGLVTDTESPDKKLRNCKLTLVKMALRRSYSAGELADRDEDTAREVAARREKEAPQLIATRMLREGVEVPLTAVEFRRLMAHNLITLSFCDANSSVAYWIERGKWPPTWTSDLGVLLLAAKLLERYDDIPTDAVDMMHRQNLAAAAAAAATASTSAAAAAAAAAYELMLDVNGDEPLECPPTPGKGLLSETDSDEGGNNKLDTNQYTDTPSGSGGNK